jgi:hypothetical protein
MSKNETDTFSAKLKIIGINPFVYLPANILNSLFVHAKKNKGPIPVKGTINGNQYKQTLVKYRGEWRLYINTTMLKNSPKHIGEIITVTIEFDPEDRTTPIHPKLAAALKNDQIAKNAFVNLTASLQKEINLYISFLKSEKSIDKNVTLAIGFLKGQNKFIGRTNLKNQTE